MTHHEAEQQDADRLRKADEFVTHCKAVEDQARRDLATAIEQTKRARQKCSDLFTQNEVLAVEGRRAGHVVNSVD